jgi:hypothetical protein
MKTRRPAGTGRLQQAIHGAGEAPFGGSASEAADPELSESTIRNWARLGEDGTGRLASRANKRLSRRRVMPSEYADARSSAVFASRLASRIAESGCGAQKAFWSLGLNLLRRAGIAEKPSCSRALADYADIEPCPRLASIELPQERDILGLVYECLLSEGRRNESGCYYTPWRIARKMLERMELSSGATLLDPCCGSGAFLLAADAPDPSQLCGIDIDPVAVMIARINLLLKYPDRDFVPDVHCADFLRDGAGGRRFDFIATNPPWGAAHGGALVEGIRSGESASLFFAKSFSVLRKGGLACFLFPEAVLNVKLHRDLRQFMLEKADLRRIAVYGPMFSGVMTGFAAICARKAPPSGRPVEAVFGGSARLVNPDEFRSSPNLVFSMMTDSEAVIVRKSLEKGAHTLGQSEWALGIVTGDNRRLLSPSRLEGMEPIYTGKEIKPYRLLEPANFIRYDRRCLQQAAPDRIYRAGEKLAYKFISNKLAFACDTSGSLFLNSANLLIPKIPGMSVKTVMAFLNSSLYSFLYSKMFGDVKVLKGNLMELPFPDITPDDDRELSRLAALASGGDPDAPAAVDALVFRIFSLDGEEAGEVLANTGAERIGCRKSRCRSCLK